MPPPSALEPLLEHPLPSRGQSLEKQWKLGQDEVLNCSFLMPLQMIHHGGVLCLAALVLSVAHAHAEELEPLFKNPLVLVELVSQQPFEGELDPDLPIFYGRPTHNFRVKVLKVFDGPASLVDLELLLAGAVYREGVIGEDEKWVSNETWLRPIGPPLDEGLRMVMHLVKAEEYEYPEFNPYNLPIGSVFFSTEQNSSFNDKFEDPKPFETRLEWAEMVQKIAETQDHEDRLKLLVENLSSPNRMISTMSVHLLERLYPEKAIPLFEKAVFAPQAAFAARLAMDHELILAKGREWVEANHEKLTEALQAAEDFDESLFSVRAVGLRLGTWFHRQRQIRQPPPLELRGQ